jgi:addiction module RelE/StbE family toxin
VIKITWDQGCKRVYKKKVKNNDEQKKKFWHAMKLFSNNPFNPRLRTHKLTGKLEGLWAFSYSYDCRVIFKFINKDEVLLIDLGSHDEVY